MDLHQLRYSLLKLSCLILLATTWVFFSFVFESRPEPELNVSEASVVPPSPMRREVNQVMQSLLRLPASLPAQLPSVVPSVLISSSHVVAPVRMDVVDVMCWDRPQKSPLQSEARWVRLTGKACQSQSGSDQVTLANLSNGYAATVFDSSRGQLTTDFIPLSAGRNEILIRFNSEAGATVENRLILTR